MQNKVVQISLWETYTKVSEAEESDVPEFLRLLDEYLDWDDHPGTIPACVLFVYRAAAYILA
jgi:hypothetical protein